MPEYVTHFGDYDDETMVELVENPRTLCGLPITAIIMNDRPATCSACTAAHAAKGWTFPLPETVAVD